MKFKNCRPLSASVVHTATIAKVFAIVVGVLMSSSAIAENVTGNIEAFLVTESADGEQLIPADTAAPGEVMEFQIAFTNAGDQEVTGIRVVDPIPENTRFIGESQSADVDAAFEVSIDGGETFEREPVTRIETQTDGSQKEVVIDPSEYTHVRWLAEEALGADGGRHAFSYRVAIN